MLKLILFFALAATVVFGQAQPVKRVVRCTDSSVGGNDTYTATASPVLSAYSEDQWYEIRVLTANTLTATMDCGPGAKNIVKMTGTVSTALATNDLLPKGTYLAVYNATDDNLKIISGTPFPTSSGGVYSFHCCQGTAVFPASQTHWAIGGFASFNSATQVLRTTAFVPLDTGESCTVGNLRVSTTGSAGATLSLAAGTLQVDVAINGTASAVTCTVGTGTSSCSDLTNSATANAGDYVSFKFTAGAYSTAPYVLASFDCRR